MSNNITEEVFYKEYKPIKNHYDPNAAFDGHMFETYGEELDFIKGINHWHVWTIIESEGKMYICAGFHYVNRVGYMVTQKEWNSDEIEVALDEDELTLSEAIEYVEDALKFYVEDCLDATVDDLEILEQSWNLIKSRVE